VAVFSTPGEYTEQVLGVVESIPPGRVMTYGDVAAVFPPSGLAERALLEYEREGTPLLPADTEAGYRIDYDRAAWSP
jgi:hypothetical protein